eukprot:SAG31_NODE_1463_length_8238_cov_3.389851_4_plen_112_part_00
MHSLVCATASKKAIWNFMELCDYNKFRNVEMMSIIHRIQCSSAIICITSLLHELAVLAVATQSMTTEFGVSRSKSSRASSSSAESTLLIAQPCVLQSTSKSLGAESSSCLR